MPFIANTPESLIARSDSKNPATTCRGITSSGRPCRRPLAASDAPAPTMKTKFGRLRVDDPRDERLYCWQHKEQASHSARSSPGPRTSITPILEERTSLDTLADRLGLVDARSSRPDRPAKKPTSGAAYNGGGSGEKPRPSVMTRPKPKMHITFCCCFKVPVDEVHPPPRPKPRPVQPTTSSAPAARPSKTPQSSHPPPPRPSLSAVQPQPQNSGRSSHHHHHSSTPSASSQTAQYLSLIPAGASPQTASLLMAELAKPLSQVDEPGYIYMFWLTPETQPSAPPADAARSLLLGPPSNPATPTRPGAGQSRRVSDVLASYATATGSGSGSRSGSAAGPRGSGSGPGPGKILLKIGRANNVQRRLNEWKRQCGYNLSLIRYYPYLSSSGSSPGAGAGGAVPRKMPHSHKVERLIHIELAGAGLRVADRDKCDSCGREHREWFEVEATRRKVMEVDEVVRRWVDWDESRT